MPLNVSCCSSAANQTQTDLLALGVYAFEHFQSLHIVSKLDSVLHGAVQQAMKREEFTGKKDQKLVIDTLGLLPAKRLLLVGLGDAYQASQSEQVFRAFGFSAAAATNQAKFSSVAVGLQGPINASQARCIAEGIVLGAYRFTKYLTGERLPKTEIVSGMIIDPDLHQDVTTAVELGARIAVCVTYARDLINEPPNVLTPVAMASYAEKIAKDHNLICKVMGPDELQQMNMGLYLAVAQGSANPPRLIHLTYKPETANPKRYVFVGKGLTFDSGGLCIKPAAGMGDMKSDMSGAANVIALMAAVAELHPNVEVHAIAAAAENMPDGAAYRPADVLRAMNGKTVEVINTDAEGRLVLADALTYAARLKPDAIVCNATLTGACVVALGQTCSGVFCENLALSEQFKHAYDQVGEQFWPLPMLSSLRENLKSDVADLKHTGGRWAGAITAALFLAEFVDTVPFLHCDIAGPAFCEKPYSFYSKGGTGQGILSFLRFIEHASKPSEDN